MMLVTTASNDGLLLLMIFNAMKYDISTHLSFAQHLQQGPFKQATVRLKAFVGQLSLPIAN